MDGCRPLVRDGSGTSPNLDDDGVESRREAADPARWSRTGTATREEHHGRQRPGRSRASRLPGRRVPRRQGQLLRRDGGSAGITRRPRAHPRLGSARAAQGADGSVEVAELHELAATNVGEMLELEADLAMLLAEEDVEAIGGALEPEASRPCSSTRTRGPARSRRPCAGRVASWSPTAASPPRRCSRRSERTHKPSRKEPEMPLARARRGRPGVIGDRSGEQRRSSGPPPSSATVTTGGTIRDDRGDRRDDRGVCDSARRTRA